MRIKLVVAALCAIVLTNARPAYAGQAAGQAAAQKFIANQRAAGALSASALAGGATSHVPSSVNQMQQVNQVLQDAKTNNVQNSNVLKGQTTTKKYIANVLSNTSSVHGSCDITDNRVYCEAAVWTITKTVTAAITSATKMPASRALCLAKTTPPTGYTQNNLASWSGGAVNFTGTVTCNYTKNVRATTINYSGQLIKGAAFIGIPKSSHQTITTTITTAKKPLSASVIKCQCVQAYRTQYNVVSLTPNSCQLTVVGSVKYLSGSATYK